MSRVCTAGGALLGGLCRGWKGAIFGAALGYGLDLLLEERPRPVAERGAEGPVHPEEEMLNAMRRAENDSAAEGAELAVLYGDVLGPHPAGLVDAELHAGEKGG